MGDYTKAEIEELLETKPFWGYMKDYIRNNKSIQNLTFRMLKREKKSWHTLRRYFSGIKTLCEFLKVETPDAALEKIQAEDDPSFKLDDYVDYLTQKGFTPINIKSHWFGVKKWLISNRVTVEWSLIGRPKVATRIRDRIPTIQELRRILSNNVALRDRALFMTCATGGLRVGTAVRLKVKDYKPREDGYAIINVTGGEGKKLSAGMWYFTFITPETNQTIQDYLATRGNVKPEDPLFTRIDKPRAFDKYTTNVSRQWRRLLKRAKLAYKVENHTWMAMHLHVLRKFFQTSCNRAGVDAKYYDFWMGHVSTGKEHYLNDSYFRATVQEHLAEYRKVAPYLTIFGTIDVVKVEEFQRLRNEMEKLRAMVAELAQKG